MHVILIGGLEDRVERDPKVLFGQRVRDLRKKYCVSQEDLALEAGLDRTYVSGIETGKRNVSLVNIFKLAKAFNLSPSALFDFELENEDDSPPDNDQAEETHPT